MTAAILRYGPLRVLAMYGAFLVLIGAALLAEGIGRLRHGKDYEPGDGLGRPEDYENHGSE